MKRPPPWSPPDPLPSRRETARLVLRYWTADDAPTFLEAIDSDRAALARFLPWVDGDNRNLAECTFHVERFRRKREEREPAATDFAIGMFDRETGRAVGGTGFHRIDAETGQAEIGYWVRPDRQRQGLCTEAVRALLTWGFEQQPSGWGFRRIVILCAGPNVGSRRVPEKLGLRPEVHLRRDRWMDDEGWVDTIGFGVCADEWDQGSGVVAAK